MPRATYPELKSGEIWLNGAALHKMRDFAAAKHGVQLAQEDRRIIHGLTTCS